MKKSPENFKQKWSTLFKKHTLTLTLNLAVAVADSMENRMNQNNQLHHEKLEVYQVSIQFLALVSVLIKNLPRGNGEIKDQLKSASFSIILNISEGYGKNGPDDRSRFYEIAKGSSNESAAILDVCKILGIISEEEHNKGKNLLYRIVCMLVKLCQYQRSS